MHACATPQSHCQCTALRVLVLPSVGGTLDAARLQHLQPLSQLPALEMLYMANAACRTSGLAALARVRPWTRLQFLELDDDGDGGIGAHGGGEDWAFPALQALYLRSPTISLQRVEQLAMHCPVLVEVTRQEGVPCSVRLCIPAAASAAQAAAQLRRLQHLHGRHLLKSLHVSGKDGLPPVAVLSEAAAQTWCLSLPGVEELQVVHWDDAESSTEQHLAWLLGLLPNVRLLEFGDCGQLSGGGALAALQQHVQLRQQQPGGKDRTMVVRLSGDLPGFSWEGLCAWAAALPAGHHAPLEFLLVDAYLEDMPEGAPAQPLAGTTLTRMLRVAGRGHVTVRIAEAK